MRTPIINTGDHPTRNDCPLPIPPIVFGTSALGNLYQSIDDDVKREIVSQWFRQSPKVTGSDREAAKSESGSASKRMVAADSAGKYGAGLALESMSRSLSELQIDPTEILISNKLGWRRVPLTGPEPTFEPGAWVGLAHDAVQDISYDGILRCWEQGCELMHPYRAQMVSVHDPDEYLASAANEDERMQRWEDIIAAYQALRELRDRGEVTAIGVGAKDWRVSAKLAEQCDLDWVMLATSLTVHTHPPELLSFIETLRQQGTAVINSAVFHAGFLTGGNFFDYRQVTGQSSGDQELIDYRNRFHDVCGRFDVKPAEACVAFGMSVPGVVSTALNSSRPQRIEQNVALVYASLSSEFWTAMKQAKLIRDDYPYV